MIAELLANGIHRLTSYLSHQAASTRKGHGVHSPFVYDLCENVFYNHHPHYAFGRLDRLRKELLSNDDEIDTGNFGAGSFYHRSQKKKISRIASKGISTKKQSEILYRLCNYLHVGTCVELGTSLGLNTLYLASHNPQGRVITIEGSRNLSAFAEQLAKRSKIHNIEFHSGDFDKVLPSIIKGFKGNTLFYIDGNHTYEATLRYFNAFLPLMKGNSVMVFDDIYWSKAMTRAWKKIIAHPQVKLSIDTYHSGYAFLKEEFREKSHFRLAL